MYEVFEHTADVGLRMVAPTLAQLFVDAGRGLSALLVANPEAVQPRQVRSIRLNAEELEFLLFDWLHELLYLFETDRLVPCEFQIEVGEGGLTAEVRGEPLDPTRHRPEHEIKAITYHGLRCESTGDGWLAEVIVDI